MVWGSETKAAELVAGRRSPKFNMDEKIRIGIVGGSGLYEMEELADVEHVSIKTPFGATSGDYLIGTLKGVRVAFLSRHGKGHRLSPSELNYRANIYGFKKLGVEQLISVTAVESLKKNGHLETHMGSPTAMRGGMRKRYYRITDAGIKALVKANEIHEKIMDGFADLLRRHRELKST